MRPRVFPAEDEVVFRGLPAILPASMRPRVFPAEDTAIGFSNFALIQLQ